jgi:hypothetical protein
MASEYPVANSAHDGFMLNMGDDRQPSGPYFPVASVHRNDITNAGYDASNLTDEDMEYIASRMQTSELMTAFWAAITKVCYHKGVPELQQED